MNVWSSCPVQLNQCRCYLLKWKALEKFFDRQWVWYVYENSEWTIRNISGAKNRDQNPGMSFGSHRYNDGI